MKILLPITPMSINKCYQGRRFRTKEYKAWQEHGIYLLKGQYGLSGKFHVKIKWYKKTVASTDIDNPVKPVVDLLVKSGVIPDDRYIYKLEVEKHKTPEGQEDYYDIEILPFPNVDNF